MLSEASLLEEEEEEDALVVKALMGLANAHPQLLPLPSSTVEETQEEEDAEDDDEVTAKPPKIPPHLTLSFMQWFTTPAGFPSRRDSTLLRVQSPRPEEILSKKSAEKLLLPHPTDLDLETLEEEELKHLSSSIIT